MGTETEKWLLPDTSPNYDKSLYRGITTAPTADLKYGAHNGFITKPAEFAGSASYIQGNTVCILLEAPLGFQKLDHSVQRVATLKSLVEEQARTIDGLNSTLTVSMSETPIGGSQEVHQDITNVECARSAPSYTWDERLGRAIGLFFEDWITLLGMDYTTKIPRIINYRNSVTPRDFLPAFRTMTCLFFEPDPTFRTVVNSWLCSNMFPMSAGENVGSRDLTTEGSTRDITIEFSAITQRGYEVTKFAQSKLDSMNLVNVNPYHQAAILDSVTKDVEAADSGFIKGLDSVER